ncbi:MAG: hypothetical protein HQ579_00770, partial [Candidatus Omnitrophica bacterium]|nr:hypothetical protein [Candidatus Omnitrophota bacterium]
MGIDLDKTKSAESRSISMGLSAIQTTLRNRIKLYLRRAREVEEYLRVHPNEWGKFQNEFNSEIDAIFRDIMDFEKTNITTGNKDKIEKLKKLFVNRIRKIFMRGVYIEWSLKKPYGYAGDFKIIDDIYKNNPGTKGFDRLFDNYYQMKLALQDFTEKELGSILSELAKFTDEPFKLLKAKIDGALVKR